MRPVTIRMDDLYKGKVQRVEFDKKNRVNAILSTLDRHPVAYEFWGRYWTEVKARTYLKNRNMNDILYRQRDDGNITCNQIVLSAKVTDHFEGETVREILGADRFAKLSAIESEYGSSKPFILEIIAMNFNGKEKAVGNGLEFDRKIETDAIKEFASLTVNKGHLGWLEDFQTPIGNTVASKVGENGDPVVYAYIYPHDDAGQFRTNLRLAAAQGPDMLSKYTVSMRGKPIDMEYVDDDENNEMGDVGLGEKVYAKILKWQRKSLDFVVDPALPESKTINILNSKTGESINMTFPDDNFDWHTPKHKGVKKVDITLSEAQDVLRERESIAFSDLYSIPCCKKAIDEYIALKLSGRDAELSADKSFIEKIFTGLNDETIAAHERVNGIVEDAVKAYKEKVESLKDSVEEIAKNNEVELSKAQTLWIQNGITGDESEADIVERCKQAIELSDLSDKEFSLKPPAKDEKVKDGKVVAMSESGSTVEIVGGDDKIEL